MASKQLFRHSIIIDDATSVFGVVFVDKTRRNWYLRTWGRMDRCSSLKAVKNLAMELYGTKA